MLLLEGKQLGQRRYVVNICDLNHLQSIIAGLPSERSSREFFRSKHTTVTPKVCFENINEENFVLA